MKRTLLALLLAGASVLTAPVVEAQYGTTKAPVATAAMAEGEIRKVDKDAKKLTIRHGPLPQLDMPTPMTMVYQVRNTALLDQVGNGDRIRFVAEKIDGAFVVTHIEPAR